MKLFSRKAVFAFVLCFALLPSLHADEWYTPFFIEGSGQYYIAPGPVADLIEPAAGFRAAVGYEYRNFHLALESGFSRINGTNPLVLDIRFVPLCLEAGYLLPVYKGFGLEANLGIGAAFSATNHYETAIDLLLDKQAESRERSFMTGFRLYGTYTFGGGFLKLYAGGGFDSIFETDGPIPLPVIEAGISFKPFAAFRTRAPGREDPREETPPPSPVNIEPEDIVFSHTQENLIIEESESGRTIRMMNALYFEGNSVTMLESYRPVLDEAGARLRDDPSLRITLRAYAAPFGTTEGQVAVSAARAWFCVEYYMKHYGIAEERMHIEYYGAEREPEWTNATWESYRCVELIIESITPP